MRCGRVKRWLFTSDVSEPRTPLIGQLRCALRLFFTVDLRDDIYGELLYKRESVARRRKGSLRLPGSYARFLIITDIGRERNPNSPSFFISLSGTLFGYEALKICEDVLRGLSNVICEIDKTRNVRRVLGRLFGAATRSGGDEETEMGSVGSDDEDEPRLGSLANKKFKIHKKFFHDHNPVDNASVPRKLRSAMKKRGCKQNSSPLPKRLNHSVNGSESPKVDCLKKSKLNTQNGFSDRSPRWAIAGSISKDEQEVAETLYALAGLIPCKGVSLENKSDGGSSLGKSLDLSKKLEDSKPASEVCTVIEEDSEATRLGTSGELIDLTTAAGGNVKVDSLTEPALLSQPELFNSTQYNLNVNTSAPQVRLQTICPFSKSESGDDNHPKSFPCVGVASHLKLDDVRVNNEEDVVDVSSQEGRWDITMEKKENGLFSKGSHASGVDADPLYSSAANSPSWPSTAASTKPLSHECGNSTEKVFRFVNHQRKSWKKCAAHVYISRLIQLLQISEGKGIRQQSSDNLSQGVFAASGHLNSMTNGFSRTASAPRALDSASKKNLNDAGNGVLNYERIHQDYKQPSPAFKCFDFLSLSTGNGGPEAKIDANVLKQGLEPQAQYRVCYRHSLPPHTAVFPFRLPQNHHPANPNGDQIYAAAAAPSLQFHLQLPPYFGSPFGPSNVGSTTSTAQPPLLPQQSRTAQYGSGTFSESHIPTLQNSRHDNRHSSMQYMKAFLPPSQSSFETIGSEHLRVSQQQQVIALASSLPPTLTKNSTRPSTFHL
ncbi:hypothetical protein Nepgr_019857 [Nepenthes gracilis]|uniref:Uncharacterized protein n=1 Tax=Nepenthes gracilis TaxID=150966 RepID=A0AAD3XVS1_NEPGR|nr:hypothetical protein Nepgr_019857 [Nepenthes gracilis]